MTKHACTLTCLCGLASLNSSLQSCSLHSQPVGPKGSGFSLREKRILSRGEPASGCSGAQPLLHSSHQMDGEWDPPPHSWACSLNSSALGLWSLLFIFSGFGNGKHGASSARGFAHVLDPRDPPHLLSFLGDRVRARASRALERAHTPFWRLPPQNEKEGLKK